MSLVKRASRRATSHARIGLPLKDTLVPLDMADILTGLLIVQAASLARGLGTASASAMLCRAARQAFAAGCGSALAGASGLDVASCEVFGSKRSGDAAGRWPGTGTLAPSSFSLSATGPAKLVVERLRAAQRSAAFAVVGLMVFKRIYALFVAAMMLENGSCRHHWLWWHSAGLGWRLVPRSAGVGCV